MNHDEQRVRTMAGWIGVEISRSRVRTPGKAGFGLYRVRGSKVIERALATLGPDMKSRELTEWTAYAFGMDVIDAAVRNSIEQGRPEGPMALRLVEDGTAVKTGAGGYAAMVVVPTRWTSAYRGRRDLGMEKLERDEPAVAEASRRVDETRADILRKARAGGWEPPSAMCHRCPLDDRGEQCRGTVRIGVDEEYGTCSRCGRESGRDFLARSIPVQVRPEYAAQLDALAALLDEGLVEMVHVEGCGCVDPPAKMSAACARATMPERMRQRADNAAFQAEHLERRRYGKAKYHADKLARNTVKGKNGDGPAPGLASP